MKHLFKKNDEYFNKFSQLLKCYQHLKSKIFLNKFT
jgi:hypothetical protein